VPRVVLSTDRRHPEERDGRSVVAGKVNCSPDETGAIVEGEHLDGGPGREPDEEPRGDVRLLLDVHDTTEPDQTPDVLGGCRVGDEPNDGERR
jgi:hypothetical protein